MVKISKKNTWKPVDLDGALFNGETNGLVGIEECTDYDLDFVNKKKKKSNKIKDNILNKIDTKSKAVKKKKKLKKQSKEVLEEKASATEEEQNEFVPSKSGIADDEGWEMQDEISKKYDMQGWDTVPLPKSILDALEEQKFYTPTEIQTLTLPSAIIGKRDILGAAETGSGKTLAFGIPILCGILKLKEKQKSSINNMELDINVEKSENNEDLSEEEISNSEVEEEQKTDSDNEGSLNEDSDESDFEEIEEAVEDLDENGVGCVRIINNIGMGGKAVTRKPLYALILTPTRELAVQIRNHLIAAAKYTGINVAVVVGGMAAVKQERILNKGPEIVVATPGRVWELIENGNPHLSQIEDISYLAIDETDRMIEKGHFKELHNILEKLNENEEKKKCRQNFVFSATLTLVHELPRHLKTKKKILNSKRISDLTPAQKLKQVVDILGITNPKVVDITQGKGTSGTLTECRIICSFDEKDYYVYYFLKRHPGRTLIFCNSIGCVKRLSTLLTLLECNPLPLHASMPQRQRLKNLDRFREKENSILVATDVAARGLDIPSVEHVLHYQTPRTSESYVHRSGRTARASKEGITVLLVEPSELKNYIQLCRTLGKTEDIPLFPVKDTYLAAVKQRINLAREVDKLDLQVRKANTEAGWFQKVADDMDIVIDDYALKYDVTEAKGYKKIVDVKRKQLQKLLQVPIFPKGFSGRYPVNYDPEEIALSQGHVKTESAVDLMKKELEIKNSQKKRFKGKKLFKNKLKQTNKNINLKELIRKDNEMNNKKMGKTGKHGKKKGKSFKNK